MTTTTTAPEETETEQAEAEAPGIADKLAEDVEQLRAELDDADADDDPEPDRDASRSRTSGSTRKRSRSSSSKSKRSRSRSKGSGSKSSDRSDQREAGLRQAIERTLALVGTSVSMFEPFDGAVILAAAEDTAEALDRIAKDSPAVARVLNNLTAGGGGTPIALAMALAPIAVPILHHHGLLPSHPLVDGMAEGMIPDEAKQAAEFRAALASVPPA